MTTIISLLIALVIGYWLSEDAKTCGRDNVKWFIFGFLFGLLAVIVYYIRKPKYAK